MLLSRRLWRSFAYRDRGGHWHFIFRAILGSAPQRVSNILGHRAKPVPALATPLFAVAQVSWRVRRTIVNNLPWLV
jgi:hypothetical protein